ncbi:MAG: alpha-mannosidase [Chloroflexota bacterium]|nr:alpha-mannosidase [Chloroflexota bacterium]
MTTGEASAPRTDPEGPTIIHLVPHTHWDREWYEPFQVFRMRLVELVDQLLDSMDADERLAFTLDGQVATIDDYLEIRPENRHRIERLIADGRLAIGPWQILMDEFLVSGETLIRNLEIGWHAAEAFGAAMPVGYLPDMFGHVAQMPQILRRAGIRHAVVWRGVPAAIDRHAFTWRSPDGSSVRAEYLVGGYGNGAYLLAIPDRLADKVARYVDASRAFYGDRSILAMYGTDHAVPSPRLAQIVEDANARRDDIAVRIETLTRYIRSFDAGVADPDVPDPAVAPVWTGELRSAARANMLMNVTSARIDIKVAAGRAERILERYAEPLAALHGGAWPTRLLDLAWRRLVDNSAHDSICGCSQDAVVSQVLTRYAEAEQIGRGLVEAALRPLAAGAPRGSVVVANPSPHDRTDVVEVDVDVPAAWDTVELELGDGRRVPTQLLDRPETVLRRLNLTGRQIPELFARRLHGRELFGHSLDGHLIQDGGGERRLVLLVDDPAAAADFDVDTILDAAAAAVAGRPDEPWEVTIVRGDRRRFAAAVPVAALGISTVRPVEAAMAASDADEGAVVVGERFLDNGLVRVTVADDGTLEIVGGGVRLTGVGRLVDGGDYGDTYNYGPPAQDRLVDRPVEVEVTAADGGPIRGRLAVVTRYDWPIGLTDDGSERNPTTAPVEVTTTLELRIGEPFVRVVIAFVNPARDHRVRWHVPLPTATDRSAAEGQFAVVERGLTEEAGHGEVATPTFPAHGWVHAAGATILLDHVTEYELVDGRELALTILRSTGLISRNDNPFREDPAGPEVPVPAAQMVGPWRFGFGLLPHAGTWSTGGVAAQAEAYHLPFVTAPGTATAGQAGDDREAGDDVPIRPEPGPGSGSLRLAGRDVVLSALRRRGGELEARIVAQTGTATTVVISGRAIHAARDVDLLGRLGGDLAIEPDGRLHIALGPWEIRTIRLRDRPT